MFAGNVQNARVLFVGNDERDFDIGRIFEVLDNFSGIRASAGSENGDVVHNVIERGERGLSEGRAGVEEVSFMPSLSFLIFY